MHMKEHHSIMQHSDYKPVGTLVKNNILRGANCLIW